MGSQTFNLIAGNYRVGGAPANYTEGVNGYGTVSWLISGSTVTWTMTYQTFEWVRNGKFLGVTNSKVRLYVGESYAESSTLQFSGYPQGQQSSRSDSGWVYIKSGTLTITTNLVAGPISVRPYIVVNNGSTTLEFNLAWNVTYNGNGADGGSTATQMKVVDTDLNIASNGFTRTNYTFLGWNTEADGSGTSYAPGDTYSANAGLTLYAQWKKNNIPVFTNSNGTVYQVEKAYANIPGVGVKEVTVYTNVGGTIYELT